MAQPELPNRFNALYYLLFQSRRPMRLVNTISFFRVAAFPVFIFLLITKNLDVFKWLILVSFITDAVDGYLARKFNVISVLGSRLDSLGDDLTVLAAILGLFVFEFPFLAAHWEPIAGVLLLFFIQSVYAWIRYQKLTSFHTYFAKTAAICQGIFLCAMFFLDEPFMELFYATLIITALELIEEIIMVAYLPQWKADVRGLYWVFRDHRKME